MLKSHNKDTIDPEPLLTYFPGIIRLKAGQDVIWDALCQSDDNLLYILPTGYGKSLLFQMYALAKKHWGIVISPLIALMKDQVEKTLFPTACIHSEMKNLSEKKRILAQAAEGKFKLLYISPERLTSITLQALLQYAEVRPSFIVIDEVHCLSEWGRDFRLDYLRIKQIAEQLKLRIICCTATAGENTRMELAKELNISRKNILNPVTHERINLFISLRPASSWNETLKQFSIELPNLHRRGQGMVFVTSPKRARELSNTFSSQYKTDWYGGINAEDEDGKPRTVTERNRVQYEWLQGTVDVLFCTSAFGMGIDKPNVRWVAHLELPASLEAYWQQIGRAGRDNQDTPCLVFSCNKEFAFHRSLLTRKFGNEKNIAELADRMTTDEKVTVATGSPRNMSGDLDTRQLMAWILTKYGVYKPQLEYTPSLKFKVNGQQGVTIQGIKFKKGEHKVRYNEIQVTNRRDFILEIFHKSVLGELTVGAEEEHFIELLFQVDRRRYADCRMDVLCEIEQLHNFKRKKIEEIQRWNNNYNVNALNAIYAAIK